MTGTPASLQQKTIPLSLGYGDFTRFSKLVYDNWGLSFSDSRKSDFERGVRQAFAASTCANFDEYYALLQDQQQGATAMEQLVNALTVGESHFFRNAPQFNALYSHVLPDIIQRREHSRNLRIWSAGCSSGEEPYSIAMTLRQLIPNFDEWSITILGTDINTNALDRARKGVYGEWAFREERAKQFRTRYFAQNKRRYQLSPEIRQMVTFRQHNLAEEGYPSYESNTMFMDLILCRNVMIYFSEAVIKSIVGRFYQSLNSGGWLIVGHAEHSLTIFSKFKLYNFPSAILYKRSHHEDAFEGDAVPSLAFPTEKTHTPSLPTTAQPQQSLLPKKTAPLPVAPPPQALGDGPVEQARSLMEYGHSAQARDLLLKFVQIDATNKNPEAYTLLGRAYANVGDWIKAEYWCKQAIKINKLELDAYYVLALVFQHTDRIHLAIEAMKKVVYINRNHILGHFSLAGLYYSDGQLPRALKALDNTRRLLEMRSAEEVISDSDGVTVESLKQTIIRQQQEWSVG